MNAEHVADGLILVRLLDESLLHDMKHPGAEDTASEHPEREREDLVGIDSHSWSSAHRDTHARDDTEHHHHAVTADRQSAGDKKSRQQKNNAEPYQHQQGKVAADFIAHAVTL